MIVGDKIKLVKPMGVFKNIGEICDVVNITEDGVISFRFGGCHLGCMSYDEFLKYFEKVEVRVWSEWKNDLLEVFDINGFMTRLAIRYRDNGRRVQVRYGTLKTESCCHNEDTFDFNKGYELAKNRMFIKYLSKQVDVIAKSM